MFHAGTRASGAQVADRGRTRAVRRRPGRSVADAQRQAYALVQAIHWDRVQYRRDIGYRALVREAAGAPR